jgi:hypothetical protein
VAAVDFAKGSTTYCAGAFAAHADRDQFRSMAEERIHRKLAAILAADVVGYSRLMAADEAGTLCCTEAASANRLRSGGRRAQRPHCQADRRRHDCRVWQRDRRGELRAVRAERRRIDD